MHGFNEIFTTDTGEDGILAHIRRIFGLTVAPIEPAIEKEIIAIFDCEEVELKDIEY